MKNQRRIPRNTRKTKGGFRPIAYLLLTALIAGVVFFILERTDKTPPEKPVVKPPAVAEKTSPRPAEKPARPEPVVKPVYPEKPAVPEKSAEPGPGKKVPLPPVPPVHKRYSAPAVSVPLAKPPRISGTGTVAIIIDDMGASVREARVLMDIGVPLTFSIIPGLKDAREVASAANRNGYEVMLHIPMEPRDYPNRRLEGNGLLLSYDDDEIQKRIGGYLRMVPHAVGANNHMGSCYTEDRDRMRSVLGILKENGMFFVDSMTTP
ncbi:MAG: divergent polysaccharide deacetylase family protein, partial [Geobacteraceae bacterium]|nr:divergent polysaccharide deacetylase family protein [Geobacteraceae bacterium]